MEIKASPAFKKLVGEFIEKPTFRKRDHGSNPENMGIIALGVLKPNRTLQGLVRYLGQLQFQSILQPFPPYHLWVSEFHRTIVAYDGEHIVISSVQNLMLWYHEVATAMSMMTEQEAILEAAHKQAPSGFEKWSFKQSLRPYPSTRCRDN